MVLSLSISLRACLRLRSADEDVCVRLSQVRSRSMELLTPAARGLPVESLLLESITVDRPMSCMARDVPAPVLDLFPCSLENERHSAPMSSTFSLMTLPQMPQQSSPVESSVTSPVRPQTGHRVPECCGVIIGTRGQLRIYEFYTFVHGETGVMPHVPEKT